MFTAVFYGMIGAPQLQMSPSNDLMWLVHQVEQAASVIGTSYNRATIFRDDGAIMRSFNWKHTVTFSE